MPPQSPALMKKTMSLLTLLAAFASRGDQILFHLSPAGTDSAVGLSPANVVPAVNNSTGSGDIFAGSGIVLDTDSSTFIFGFGFGSAAGFTDLTGPATAVQIHSPALHGQNGPVIIDLAPWTYAAPDPAQGGVAFGFFTYPANELASLLSGKAYVDVHTDLNPNGELRAQIIPEGLNNNLPPVVVCSTNSTAECGSITQVTVSVSDPDGDDTNGN